ncbi:ribosomal protein S30 [Xylariaceae sp. FL0016]|nr:ribosomal protein S30 [Xylariaceae sp. FL0016]
MGKVCTADDHPSLDVADLLKAVLLPVPARVEPQEKPKVPKGRAKKRLVYTRRFVNVTLTGGKRKMNPNPGS